MSLGVRQRLGRSFGLGRALDLDAARDVRRPTVTDPKKLLPGLSVLFGFSVFHSAIVMMACGIPGAYIAQLSLLAKGRQRGSRIVRGATA
jgi:hypothetical protein